MLALGIIFGGLIVFLFLYISNSFYKIKYSLMYLQQGGYSNQRYLKQITKTNYDEFFGLNELYIILPITLFILEAYFIGAIMLAIIYFYNTRFLAVYLRSKDKKLGFNFTARAKRLFITFLVLYFLILFLAISLLPFNIFINIILIICILNILMPFIIALAKIINIPIEKIVYRYYINIARNILKKHNNLKIIGITGSYGKTSVKNIIGSILSQEQETLITPHSYNTPMGVVITVRKFLNPFVENFICEMGAYRTGEIKEICDFVHPQIGVLTSVGEQHLETFKSLNNILNTKMELIESLPKDGIAILNYDNELIRSYQIKNSNIKILWISASNKNADYYVKEIVYDQDKTKLVVKRPEKDINITMHLVGAHNILNVLMGIAVADTLKLKENNIIQAVKNLKAPKHRLEVKKIDDQTIIIDDAYNANPVGLESALNVLQKFNGRKIIITPGMIDLGKREYQLNYEFGEKIAETCDEVLLVGPKQTKPIQESLKNKNKNFLIFNKFTDAMQHASKIKKEKVILIANDLPDKFSE